MHYTLAGKGGDMTAEERERKIRDWLEYFHQRGIYGISYDDIDTMLEAGEEREMKERQTGFQMYEVLDAVKGKVMEMMESSSFSSRDLLGLAQLLKVIDRLESPKKEDE